MDGCKVGTSEVAEVMAVSRSMEKHSRMKHLLSNIINEVFSVSRLRALLHSIDGLRLSLGMANKGYRHSNGSQFYITLSDACEWMSNRFVAFGRVVEGFDTLAKLEHIDTINQRPVKGVTIVDCGTIQVKDD